MTISARAWLLGAIVCAVAFFVDFANGDFTLALVAKPLPVLCMLAMVVWRGRALDRHDRGVAIGLGLSAVGDVVLSLRGDYFVLGLLAFLAAHVAYIVGFTSETKQRPLRLLPFAAFGVAMFMLLRPGLGGLTPWIALYIVVIVTMGFTAASRLGGGEPRSAQWSRLSGAIMFMVSDGALAISKFYLPFAGARLLIMITYWLGQAGISASSPMRD
jgi:alkenylglycerophosphocholine/alkenylglycerophosphoethanolamine hydrolase